MRKQISLIAIAIITIFSLYLLNKEPKRLIYDDLKKIEIGTDEHLDKEPKWLFYGNWKKIEIGMDEHLVERHLGKAIDVDYSATTFHYNAYYRSLQDPENTKAKIYSRYIYYSQDDVGTDFNWENWDDARKLEAYGTVWAKEGKVYFFSANVIEAKGAIRGFVISRGHSDLD